MSKVKLPSLSVFFPCYNEEKNIEKLVGDFRSVLPSIAKKFEIIIVNDGSADKTKAVATALAKKYPEVRLVDHAVNRGYGSSLRTGFKAASYEWVFFTDGDGQFTPDELPEFVAASQTHDVIIGYRTNRAEGSLRALNARMFKAIVDCIYRVHVTDIDCAYKLFKTEVVQPLPLISTGAMISAEILYRLKKKGHAFKQLPVKHWPRKHGTPTGNNLRVILKAGYEVLNLYYQIKIRSIFPRV